MLLMMSGNPESTASDHTQLRLLRAHLDGVFSEKLPQIATAVRAMICRRGGALLEERYLQMLSSEQIAASHGILVGTAWVRLCRALHALRDRFQQLQHRIQAALLGIIDVDAAKKRITSFQLATDGASVLTPTLECKHMTASWTTPVEPTPRRLPLHQYFFVLGAFLLPCAPAQARLDVGGSVSRFLVIGTVEGRQTLYLTTWGYPEAGKHATLWAFCVDPTREEKKVVEDPGYPVRWKVPLSGSAGFLTYSPPAVTEDGTTIIAASENGWVYALDHQRGQEKWKYHTGAAGIRMIYAQPAIDNAGKIVYVATNTGMVHAIDLKTGIARKGWPLTLGGHIFFTPVVDIEHSSGKPRIYVATGGTPRSQKVFGIDTGSAEPIIRWTYDGAADGTGDFRMKGVIGKQKNGQRILLVASADKLVALQIDGDKAGQLVEGWKAEKGGAGNPAPVYRCHRSWPFLSTPRDPDHPAVYFQIRDGAANHGGALLKFSLENGLPGKKDQLFPRQGEVPNISFSAPAVNTGGATSGFIFFGPARGTEGTHGLYRIDPANPPGGSEPWCPIFPKGGWRTEAAFSADGKTLFIGSANGLLYSIQTDSKAGTVNWLFDTRTGKAGQ